MTRNPSASMVQMIIWGAILDIMSEKIEDIKHIQNTLWAMYKDFLSDHDVRAYNRKAQELATEYYEKGDKQLFTFLQWSIITWCPIINGFTDE